MKEEHALYNMGKIFKNSKQVIRATKEGKLYIRTKDFFRIKKVQDTIMKLLESDIVKDIEEYKRKKSS